MCPETAQGSGRLLAGLAVVARAWNTSGTDHGSVCSPFLGEMHSAPPLHVIGACLGHSVVVKGVPAVSVRAKYLSERREAKDVTALVHEISTPTTIALSRDKRDLLLPRPLKRAILVTKDPGSGGGITLRRTAYDSSRKREATRWHRTISMTAPLNGIR